MSREARILALAATGKSAVEIAVALGCDWRKVKRVIADAEPGTPEAALAQTEIAVPDSSGATAAPRIPSPAAVLATALPVDWGAGFIAPAPRERLMGKR